MPEITSNDLFLVGVLVFLEGILSVDNALVLAVLAKHLPKEQQKKALTYGLLGAFFFRLLALSMVTYLIRWKWVKFLGGGYLLFISIKHFFSKEPPSDSDLKPTVQKGFWATVFAIELTDIAFAVDSILAGVALTSKLWIVFTGGVLGIMMMRFAASILIRVIEKFPYLETTAYQLVFIIGVKVILEALHIPGLDFHSPSSLPFWVFWSIMGICIAFGFRKKKEGTPKDQASGLG